MHPSGNFGIDCRERCRRHCINKEPYHHVNGVCDSRCHDIYVGTYCNNRKTYFKSRLSPM